VNVVVVVVQRQHHLDELPDRVNVVVVVVLQRQHHLDELPDRVKVVVVVVQRQHHLDELPDGWFYNGRQYVSMDGDRSDRRPGNTSVLSSLHH